MTALQKFHDRTDAGRRLADELSHYTGEDVVILALPRGGVPVGYEVARRLAAPLDVFLVRKLGVPGREELAMGTIASGGIRVMNDEVRRGLRIPDERIDDVVTKERAELERREREYRGDRAPVDVTGRTAILVDDGLATGASMRAAVKAVQTRRPDTTVVAVPTAPRDTIDALRDEVDEVVCVATPWPFVAVGGSYIDFAQTTDDEVRSILERARNDTGQDTSKGAQ